MEYSCKAITLRSCKELDEDVKEEVEMNNEGKEDKRIPQPRSKNSPRSREQKRYDSLKFPNKKGACFYVDSINEEMIQEEKPLNATPIHVSSKENTTPWVIQIVHMIYETSPFRDKREMDE
ncbi:hypothetical protein Q3G72_018001 [Acer saccharum]|nr:hypothetical protein Q3G72_018001 [Acer saccharum]